MRRMLRMFRNEAEDEEEGGVQLEEAENTHDYGKEFNQRVREDLGLVKPMPASFVHHLQAFKRGAPFAQKACRAVTSRILPDRFSRRVALYPDPVYCGVFSPDGSQFLGSCQGSEIRLFDTQQGRFKLTKTFLPDASVQWAVVDVAFSPDKHFIAYSGWSSQVHLITIDGERRENIQLGDMHQRLCPFSLAFSPDSREIIAGCNNDSVYIYDLIDDRRLIRFRAHDDDVNAVAFADSSPNVFFTGSDDCLCKVWDRRTIDAQRANPVGGFEGHTMGITYIDSKGDGRYFISQGKDEVIKLWDIRKVQKGSQLRPLQNRVDYRFHRPMMHIDHEGDASIRAFRGHRVMRTLIRARFSPAASTGQRYIYSGSASGQVYIFDILTGDLASLIGRQCAGAAQIVRDVSWHPSEPRLIQSSWDGKQIEHAYCASGDVEGAFRSMIPTANRRRASARAAAAAAAAGAAPNGVQFNAFDGEEDDEMDDDDEYDLVEAMMGEEDDEDEDEDEEDEDAADEEDADADDMLDLDGDDVEAWDM